MQKKKKNVADIILDSISITVGFVCPQPFYPCFVSVVVAVLFVAAAAICPLTSPT